MPHKFRKACQLCCSVLSPSSSLVNEFPDDFLLQCSWFERLKDKFLCLRTVHSTRPLRPLVKSPSQSPLPSKLNGSSSLYNKPDSDVSAVQKQSNISQDTSTRLIDNRFQKPDSSPASYLALNTTSTPSSRFSTYSVENTTKIILPDVCEESANSLKGDDLKSDCALETFLVENKKVSTNVLEESRDGSAVQIQSNISQDSSSRPDVVSDVGIRAEPERTINRGGNPLVVAMVKPNNLQGPSSVTESKTGRVDLTSPVVSTADSDKKENLLTRRSLTYTISRRDWPGDFCTPTESAAKEDIGNEVTSQQSKSHPSVPSATLSPVSSSDEFRTSALSSGLATFSSVFSSELGTTSASESEPAGLGVKSSSEAGIPAVGSSVPAVGLSSIMDNNKSRKTREPIPPIQSAKCSGIPVGDIKTASQYSMKAGQWILDVRDFLSDYPPADDHDIPNAVSCNLCSRSTNHEWVELPCKHRFHKLCVSNQLAAEGLEGCRIKRQAFNERKLTRNNLEVTRVNLKLKKDATVAEVLRARRERGNPFIVPELLSDQSYPDLTKYALRVGAFISLDGRCKSCDEEFNTMENDTKCIKPVDGPHLHSVDCVIL